MHDDAMAPPLRGSDAPSCGGRFLACLTLHRLILPPGASESLYVKGSDPVKSLICTVVLSCMLAALSGCQLFQKKNGDGEGQFLGAKNKDNAPKSPPADPLAGGAGGVTELDGVLAGRVIDSIGQPADAQIRWVCMDEPKQAEVPIDVAVNAQGYFMIQGLKSGKRYKLTTRAKNGDKTLEVVTLTQAPNVHLVISVNERFAVPVNPDKGKKAAGNAKEQPASAQIPVPAAGWQDKGQPMLPPVETYGDKSRIAADQSALATRPPLGAVPSVTISPPVPQSQSSVAPGPAPVPSSVKVGLRLENFALYDLTLQPWEFRKQRCGRLVLLDFWKTNCPPCLQEMPTLKMLADQFGPQGLEIVAIAYEDGSTLFNQANAVTAVTQRWGANWQVLLGGGAACPLKRDMDVRAYPTMILLDENGVVIWRQEGALDRSKYADLEFAIKRRLTPD
jgi:thiol-disulfide isomerase/thioredoxin